LFVDAKPAYLEELKRAGLGVSLSDIGTVKFPFFIAIGQGISQSLRYTWLIITGFAGLIHDLVLGHGPSADLSGPVGIAVMTGVLAELVVVAVVVPIQALVSVQLLSPVPQIVTKPLASQSPLQVGV
jgi:hypothetical protein